MVRLRVRITIRLGLVRLRGRVGGRVGLRLR